MSLFGRNVKQIVDEFRRKSEDMSNDLDKEITESFEDLREEYEETSAVVPEFLAFVDELLPKLNPHDATKLGIFSSKLTKVGRTAMHGVEAMRELSRNQKKLKAETLREYEQFGY